MEHRTEHRTGQHKPKPGHTPGGLVGNHQKSGRQKPDQDGKDCRRADGGLVGNHQKGQPECAEK
ncbi:hypothetical protein ACI7BZ_08630 [Xanthobacter sp. AM11]|uniref:hypothetical protein n=1 Tax=Xanthobacter sp. AM11 TaxID=3380643 RepID=UPI0039BFA215